jgi:hypothetical protein
MDHRQCLSGGPVARDDTDNASAAEIGLSGLQRQGGYVYEEFLPQLKGDKAHKVYREMRDNDPVVGGVMFAIDMLLRGVTWRVEPASDKPEDEEVAEFVNGCLSDMSMTWADTISEITTFLPFGWSYHEIVYKRRAGHKNDDGATSRYDDGKIGWRKFAPRAQESWDTWEFDDSTGDLKGMWQRAWPNYDRVLIPIEKALLFRTVSNKNNPEGRSMLRNAYRPWYFKKRIEEIEGVGVERDLAGLPIAYVDPKILKSTATPEEKAMLDHIKRLAINVRRDRQEAVVFPLVYDDSGNLLYKFELLSTGGTRQFPTDAIIARYNQQIAMTVLADFILLGHEKVGSFALSSDKTNLFGTALGTFLDGICEVFNRYAIPRLVRLNGWSDEQLPTLVHGDIEKPDLASLGQYLTALAGAGAPLFPDEKLDQYLREAASLPINDEVGEQQSDDAGPPEPTLPGDQEGEKGSTGLKPEDFFGA